MEKKHPDEPVGVICTVEDVGVRVVEYSEIPKSLSEAVDSNGKLLYRAGSIANHFFTLDFLRRVCLYVLFFYCNLCLRTVCVLIL